MGNESGITHAKFFAVELDGIQTARFHKCDGLEAETYVYEVEEGGLNRHTRKFIGRTRFPNLVLEHGVSDNTELFDWYKESVLSEDKVKRKNGSVVLYDIDGSTELKRWNFMNAFPCRWVGPQLGRFMEGSAIERLEIAFEELEVDKSN